MNFRSIINNICCDSRLKEGVLNLENAEHVFVLQEYLEEAGYDINEIVEKTAKLFEAGRFPERQAYNKDGILVTFPTKEYRDRAVNKGTHFAENPKKNTGTLFAPGHTGELSTSDIDDTIDSDTTNNNEPESSKEPEDQDSKSLDQELDRKVTGDDDVDNRTPKEKYQDGEAVDYILTNNPLQNYSVNETKEWYTIEEAKELYQELAKLFKEKEYLPYIPYPPIDPYQPNPPVPIMPYYTTCEVKTNSDL